MDYNVVLINRKLYNNIEIFLIYNIFFGIGGSVVGKLLFGLIGLKFIGGLIGGLFVFFVGVVVIFYIVNIVKKEK